MAGKPHDVNLIYKKYLIYCWIYLDRYKYLDPSSSAGSWVYRVKDCDTSGSQNVICQCFVEVQSASDSKVQSVRCLIV